MKTAKSGGKRKIGRNREQCAKYAKEHHKEKNKIKKYQKMLKKLQDNSKAAMNIKSKIKELENKIMGVKV